MTPFCKVRLGNRPFILDCRSHPRGEHTEEGTAERAGEGSIVDRAFDEA